LQTTFILFLLPLLVLTRFNSPNSSDFTCSDVLNIPHTSVTDVTRAISHLRSTKCVRLDEIPNFIIKGCSDIFTPHTTFSILVYLLGVFPDFGNRQLLCLYLRKATAL
jgi:hypothetical protein